MFDTQLYDDLRQDAERVAVARTETGLATGEQAREALRTVQRVQDVLDGVHAGLLAHIEESEGYADDGASSTSAWARQELRMPAGEAGKRRRAGETLSTLPDVAAALAAGKIRLAHVFEFTSGITKLGADVMVDAQEILLPVAESCDPMVLRELISELHAVLHPDDLDDKYAKGMNRRDITAAKCGSGWHLSGFLDAVSGTKLHEFLKSVTGPECEGDDRPPSDRRVDGLERLLDNA
ncbi:MAG: 13E12 repeat family protein, partial [Actinomycetia bacterium]|nr:13E12 repeat family protein [Actinomycetes bacterium]